MTTAVQVQYRRGTASQVAAFTGAQGEMVVDTTNNRVVVQDGSTEGGWPLAGANRVAVSDAAYTLAPPYNIVAYTAITTARTVTLCAAASYPTGTKLIIVDESGSCSGTNTITVSRAGSDTIDGGTSAVIKTAYGYLALESNGSNVWAVVGASSVTGGTIDNTVIGGTTPAAASFTTLSLARHAVADAAYTVAAGIAIVAYTSISAARVVTLPAASSFNAGQQLLVVDESGSCSGTKTITLNRAGSDTINGTTSAVISSAYGYIAIESNGSNAWTIVDQVSSGGGSGTVNSGTSGQLAYYASTGTAVSGDADATISAGALTLGIAGSVQGSVNLAGSSSGSTTIAAPTSGGGTMTLQAGNDTVVGRATSDTLTNKTLTSPTLGGTVTGPDGGTWGSGGINGSVIGGTTPAAVTATTLSATGAVSLSPASHNVTLAPSGSGEVIIDPATAGTMDNMAIGGTTPAAGHFTTLSASGQITSTVSTGTAPLVVSSTTNVANLNASSLNGATFAAPGAIGGGTASTGAFTTLSASNTTVAALGVNETVPGTGIINVSGSYQVGGSQISTLNLSNGQTGTGQIVLQTSPVFEGTITGPDSGTWGSGGINGSVIGASTPAAISATTLSLSRHAVSDAAYTVAAGISTVAYTAITAARTVTLPASSSFNAGQQLLVVDESGSCSTTKTITLSPNGSDTIDGASSAVINAPYGYIAIESNASGKWTIVDQGPQVLALNGLTGDVTLAAIDGNVISASGTTVTIGGPGGMVNKFRNATMDVWQRGTASITVTTSGAYTADGWIVTPTGASCTAQQASNNRSGANTLYGLQLTGASGVTDIQLAQRIESYIAAALAGKTVTVQARVYNNTGGSITPTLTTKYAGSQDVWTSPTSDLSATNLQACANGAWTQVAYTLTVSANATNGYGFIFDFGNNFSSTSKDVVVAELDVRVTPGVSTGLNSNPPPPELRPIATELVFCQRYYAKSYSQSVAPGSSVAAGAGAMSVFWSGSGTYFGPSFRFPQTMRAQPTFTVYDNTGSSGKVSYYTSGWNNGGTPNQTTTINDSYGFVQWGGTSATAINFDYTVSAEL